MTKKGIAKVAGEHLPLGLGSIDMFSKDAISSSTSYTFRFFI